MGDELRSRAEHVLRTDVAPALGLDGDQMTVVSVADGIASVRLGAVCASCPATLMTVVSSLEQELRRQVPEIEVVEVVL